MKLGLKNAFLNQESMSIEDKAGSDYQATCEEVEWCCACLDQLPPKMGERVGHAYTSCACLLTQRCVSA
jgi:hypothetical protein